MTDSHTLTFIHRFQPSSAGSRVTLLLLHGTGGDESGLLPLQDRGAAGRLTQPARESA